MQDVGLDPVEALPPQVAVVTDGAEHGGDRDEQHEQHAEAVVEDLAADGPDRGRGCRCRTTGRPTRPAPPAPMTTVSSGYRPGPGPLRQHGRDHQQHQGADGEDQQRAGCCGRRPRCAGCWSPVHRPVTRAAGRDRCTREAGVAPTVWVGEGPRAARSRRASCGWCQRRPSRRWLADGPAVCTPVRTCGPPSTFWSAGTA